MQDDKGSMGNEWIEGAPASDSLPGSTKRDATHLGSGVMDGQSAHNATVAEGGGPKCTNDGRWSDEGPPPNSCPSPNEGPSPILLDGTPYH
eukprot:6543612-Karenia_brevis.AAC.1